MGIDPHVVKNEVVDACYVKLGKTIVDKWLATKPKYCFNFALTSLYTAMHKYDIKNASLKAALDKTMPLCKKNYARVDKTLSKTARPAAPRARDGMQPPKAR